MSRCNRRPNASTRHPVTAPAQNREVASATPQLQVRRMSFALGTLAGAALSLPVTAPALTMGEIAIGSTLGQPLQARVPVQLARGETVGPDCVVAVQDGDSAPGLPAGTNIQFGRVAGGKVDLQITTARPLYEPMYALDLALRCPGGAAIVRQYVLMLDLPGTATVAALAVPGTFNATTGPAPTLDAADGTASPPATPATVGTESVRPSTAPGSGSAYRVQSGDTLSTIAARIRDRGGLSIWQLAARIFADNPQAFIGADPDRIRLGAQILLPAPVEAAAPPTETTVSQASPAPRLETVAAPAPVLPDQPPQEKQTVGPQATTMPAAAASAAVTSSANAASPEPDRTPTSRLRKPVAKKIVSQPMKPVTAEYQAPAWQAILLGGLIGMLASAALLRERLRDTVSTLGRRWQKTSSSRLAAVKVGAAPHPLPAADARNQASTMVVEESPRELPGDDFADAVPTAQVRVDHLDDTVESPVAAAPHTEHLLWQPAASFEFNTLAHPTENDQSAANALQEMLDLLEKDHEQELTASQVIDRNRFTISVDELGDASDDDTLVRAAKIRARA